MPDKLNDNDFQEAAALLNCDVPAIKAVAEVESAGDGFLSDGRVKVLFEGHKFYKYTKGAYAQSHPTICYLKWTRAFYAKGPNPDVRGAGELARLDEAIALDRTAALMSASYGKFQIMGFNYEICGFENVATRNWRPPSSSIRNSNLPGSTNGGVALPVLRQGSRGPGLHQ